MTRPDLDALAALLAKATPGPWDAPNGETMIDRVGTEDPVADAYHYEDAALIVAAVNALPALIARVRELKQEQATLRAALAIAQEDRRAAALAMRERCAKACEELSAEWFPRDKHEAAREGAIMRCAAAVRALEV